jgi:hypothetical protein
MSSTLPRTRYRRGIWVEPLPARGKDDAYSGTSIARQARVLFLESTDRNCPFKLMAGGPVIAADRPPSCPELTAVNRLHLTAASQADDALC